jgi:hypothetical protein
VLDINPACRQFFIRSGYSDSDTGEPELPAELIRDVESVISEGVLLQKRYEAWKDRRVAYTASLAPLTQYAGERGAVAVILAVE